MIDSLPQNLFVGQCGFILADPITPPHLYCLILTKIVGGGTHLSRIKFPYLILFIYLIRCAIDNTFQQIVSTPQMFGFTIHAFTFIRFKFLLKCTDEIILNFELILLCQICRVQLEDQTYCADNKSLSRLVNLLGNDLHRLKMKWSDWIVNKVWYQWPNSQGGGGNKKKYIVRLDNKFASLQVEVDGIFPLQTCCMHQGLDF